MATAALFALMLFAPPFASGSSNVARHSTLARRSNVPPEGYFDPMDTGGSMLTKVPGTFPAGLGEPINLIMTAHSDQDVLKDQETDGGLRNLFLSWGLSGECLGQHLGDDQGADLGDGHGTLNETAVQRWDFGDPQLGSCKETINGGLHFRFWIQNGPQANSGAIFMAASYELPLALHHDIVPNGYNLGRDWVIGNATNQTSLIPTETVTNTSSYSGRTSFGNFTYQTDVQYVSGLLSNSSDGINHFLTVSVNGSNAIDGLVGVMTVKIVERPATRASSGQPTLLPIQPWHVFALVAFSALLL